MAKVEIYTWSYCPYCMQAKQLLDSKDIEYTEYVIDDDESAREAMAQRGNGKRSVPQIFINNSHIGGNDAIQQLERQGKLDPLLT